MVILQILVVLLLFTLVVGVHELGHYLVARWRGMDVEEFCILGLPFGKKVTLWTTKSGMPVTMHPFAPLGGFVRIKGMEPKADGSETSVENGFYARGMGSRASVLFAGPLFSILFGFLFFWTALVAFGEMKPLEAPIIGEVVPKAPAAAAGLQKGDRILSIAGQPIAKFVDMRKVVGASAGKEIVFEIERGGVRKQLTLKPELKKHMAVLGPDSEPQKDGKGNYLYRDQGYIGVAPQEITVRVSLFRAAQDSATLCYKIAVETARVLASPAQLKENAGGVISIAGAASKATDEGVPYFVRLAGLISVSLGLINLLPIPLMDGGQLVVVFVEALRGGRRLSIRTQEVIGFVGLVLIGLMFIGATYLDVGRLLKG